MMIETNLIRGSPPRHISLNCESLVLAKMSLRGDFEVVHACVLIIMDRFR